jgi:PHP family Zn ribbon phosphoesterase
VLNRISTIAERSARVTSTTAPGVKQRDDGMHVDPSGRRPPFRRLVPLDEVIAAALGRGPATKGVRAAYNHLITIVGSELHVLENVPFADLVAASNEAIARAIIDVRLGNVTVQPGYDGVYGTVTLAGA